jgi:hypothetical protein
MSLLLLLGICPEFMSIALPRKASTPSVLPPRLFGSDLSLLFVRNFPTTHFECPQILLRGRRDLSSRLMRKHIRLPASPVRLHLLICEPGQPAILFYL